MTVIKGEEVQVICEKLKEKQRIKKHFEFLQSSSLVVMLQELIHVVKKVSIVLYYNSSAASQCWGRELGVRKD